jgi:alkaline phosphatase
MKNYIISTVAIMFLLSCSVQVDVQDKSTTVKQQPTASQAKVVPNKVILLIGDGMGIAQITAGMYQMDQPMQMERFKVIGLQKNHASNDLITDSAAGATAFACGVRTYNKAIGVDRDTLAVESILEEAEKKGWGTGLIATSEITHATPASFIAHVPFRNQYEEIAEAFLDTEVDVFIGGGMKYFNRREKDNRNIISELEQKGYLISDFTKVDFEDAGLVNADRFGYFTSHDKPLPKSQGRDYLEPATQLSIDFLDRKFEKGFFLMIESSQIDWGGHANNINYVVSEMKEFDRVIGRVLDFAARDGRTLVIVTADHECGGLAMTYGTTREKLNASFATDGHTLNLIPVFAYGPGAELFSGIYDNYDIYHKMRKALEW